MNATITSVRSHNGRKADKWRAVVTYGSQEIFSSHWHDCCYEAMCEAIEFYKKMGGNDHA
jgi:hypothetical protein